MFEIGDRVYHRRKNDSIARSGYGTILEIGPLKARLLWEDDKLEGAVDVRDLLTEQEAAKEVLV